ncbi:MAG: ion transporter [Leptospiraceae bacterium]|nr:ion transporter [Leptospiraceae bacterium]
MKEKLGVLIKNFIMFLIIVNVITVIAESDQNLHEKYVKWFYLFEVFSVMVFSIEYIFRLVQVYRAAPERKLFTLGKYIISPVALIDLLAVLPFYLPYIVTMDLRFVRILRIFRLIRLFKLSRYAESMKMILEIIVAKKEELIISVLMTGVLLIMASVVMYEFEHEVQPKSFSSIMATMWWAVATVTTVGYGDVYPVTPIGQILSSIIALLGVGVMAIPTGILSAAFIEAMGKKNLSALKNCPHCGGSLLDNSDNTPNHAHEQKIK